MAVKTPVKATFSGSNVTGLAEFQTADFIAVADGGTGLTALGSASTVLKVNAGGTALEYGNVEAIVNIDGATDLTSNTLATTDLLLASDGGTEGRITLGQIDTLFTSTTQTLTNKSIDLTNNTLTGSLTEFNTALQSESFVGLAATQTLTNKTLTSPKINEDVVVTATATEINHTDGVTSNIQTQLDTKATSSFAIAQAVALG